MMIENEVTWQVDGCRLHHGPRPDLGKCAKFCGGPKLAPVTVRVSEHSRPQFSPPLLRLAERTTTVPNRLCLGIPWSSPHSPTRRARGQPPIRPKPESPRCSLPVGQA